jgi:hypothetical protein
MKTIPPEAQATFAFVKAQAEAFGGSVEFDRVEGGEMFYTLKLPVPLALVSIVNVNLDGKP